MANILIDADPEIPCHCENCEWTGKAKDLSEVHDFQERVSAGEITPAGECPECGCLALYDDSHTPAWSAQRVLANRQWRLIDDDAKGGQASPVIIAVYCPGHPKRWCTGEAYWHPTKPEGGDFWWAGTSPDDYRVDSVTDMTGTPVFYQPMPEPPPSWMATQTEADSQESVS